MDDGVVENGFYDDGGGYRWLKTIERSKQSWILRPQIQSLARNSWMHETYEFKCIEPLSLHPLQ